jgi:disulfide oxidoreductase YuzD
MLNSPHCCFKQVTQIKTILSIKLDKINQRNLPIIITIITLTAIIFLKPPQTPTEEPQEFTLTLPQTHPSELTTQHYLEDYQYLCTMIETNYPYLTLKNRTLHKDWLDRRPTTTAKLQNCTTNTEFLSIITREITALQNRHTHLLTPAEVQEYHTVYADISFMAQVFSEEVAEANQYWQSSYLDHYYTTTKRYPVEIMYDRGNYIITNRQGSTRTQYGTNLTLTHINNTPVNEAIKTADTYIDHDPIRDQPYTWTITPAAFPDATLTLQHPNGTQFTLTPPTVYGSQKTNFYPAPNLITRKYPNTSTAYIYIKTFDPPTIQELTPTIHQFLQETHDYQYLIIDIRGNTGGAFRSWLNTIVRPLIEKPTLHEYYLGYRNDPYIKSFHNQWLENSEPVPKNHFNELPPELNTPNYLLYNSSTTYNPENTINHTAKRILLTDRTVYSAAEGFTNFCKQTDFATIIGTTTGGDGFFIWPVYIVLPHSKLVITATSSMSLDNQGRANEETRTTPDIIHETNITDHQELIDYTLRLIMETPEKLNNE